MDNWREAVVFHNGTGTMRFGVAGEEKPRTIEPNIVGRSRRTAVSPLNHTPDLYVGDEAERKREILSLSRPIKHGIVEDWYGMSKMWNSVVCYHLREGNLTLRNVFLTEAPFNPTSNRMKMAQCMFEEYHTPAIYIKAYPILALRASGRNTGIVLHSGEGLTTAVPIVNGSIIPHASVRYDFGGAELTEYLARLLTEIGSYLGFESAAKREIVRHIKETSCFVALDFERTMQLATCSAEIEKNYELPNCHKLTLGDIRFRCMEALFKPKYLGLTYPGVHEMVYMSIMQCDEDIRPSLWNNIVLSGGSTSCVGFADRIHKELSALAPECTNIRIISADDKKNLIWLGGSMMASLSSMKDLWIEQQEYNEIGPQVMFKHI